MQSATPETFANNGVTPTLAPVQHRCGHCNATFAQRVDMKQHAVAKQHFWYCPQPECKPRREYFDMSSLRAHFLAKHPRSCLSPCTFCPEVFITTQTLKRHERTHRNETPRPPPTPARERSASNTAGPSNVRSPTIPDHPPGLNRDINDIVPGRREPAPLIQMDVQCPECRIFFLTRDRLASHFTEIHGREMAECDKCQRYFSTVEELLGHYRSGDAHPKCGICNAALYDKPALISHLYSHPVCEICNQRCRDLAEHSALAHVPGPAPGPAYDISQASGSNTYIPAKVENIVPKRSWADYSENSVIGDTPIPGTPIPDDCRPASRQSCCSVAEPIVVEGTSNGTTNEPGAEETTASDSKTLTESPFGASPEAGISDETQSEGTDQQLPYSESPPTSLGSQPSLVAPFFNCKLCCHGVDDPTALVCGHIFCHGCIIEELSKNLRCPTCHNTVLVRLRV